MNNFPKLHNAAWPGVVGKGSEGGEPFIDLDTMLNLTAAAQVNGTKFDGVDLFLFAPHVDIDSSEADRKQFVTQVRKGCRIAKKLRELGIRPYGVVRIDSASGPGDWLKDTEGNQQRIAATFREACDVAAGSG